MNYNKLKSILEEYQEFVLVCHVDPDGDAIGSLSAMAEMLEALGKKVHRVCKNTVPTVFSFLIETDLVQNDWPTNLPAGGWAIILLDNGDFRRTGFPDEITKARNSQIPIVNIDHHPKNDLWRIAKINCVDDTASSTGEMLYRIFTEFEWTIINSIATALLAGIFYDTGSFQHQNTTPKVLEMTGDLLRLGAKLKLITQKMVNDRSISLFKLWGIALSRLTVNNKYNISYSIITRQDLAETEATEVEILGLVNLLNTNAESRLTLLLYESENGKIKGSLRTENNDLNMSKFAASLNGGGHKKAAGFMLGGKIVCAGDGWKIV
jgi:phosphoesterase RecJ-like protein